MTTIRMSSLAVLAILLVSPRSAEGWGPIAHWLIAQRAGSDPEYANLPDIWPSPEYVTPVTEYFCFSHAVVDQGRIPHLDYPAPDYPDDGREPGLTMYLLAKYKLRFERPSELDYALKTAEGFVCHNAADRVVHYSYFLGSSWTNWRIHHRDKEQWAEYVVFTRWRVFPHIEDPSETFDADGNLRHPEEVFDSEGNVRPQHAFLVRVRGDCFIIHMAQKIYRKNGRKTDFDGTGTIDVETPKTISNRMGDTYDEIGNNVYRLTQVRWAELHAEAVRNGWSISECLQMFRNSEDTAKAWITYMKSL